jgi:protein required for attachment to host cells
MKRNDTWVLVADASRARLFRIGDDHHLEPAYAHDIVGSDLQSREMGSDRPGRMYDRKGGGRHAAEPPTDLKRHAKFELAHEVAAILDAERKKNAFEQLVVVAPPQFLGDLRASMPDHVQHLIVREINKDLSALSARDLEAQLAGLLPGS